MHTKLVMPGSWNFGDSLVSQVKVASAGIVGEDYRQLVKRAGEEAAYRFKHMKLAKDEIPLHLIAMGGKEVWGPNRNGDGFSRNILKENHQSFVKNARWYRNHKNKDKAISYGYVKEAYYNPEMERVELLVMLNATKEAAERNNGFVADREMEKLASNKDLAVSMACTVPHDICDACGNKARTRLDYCKEATCKEGYMGCFSKLAHVYDDGYMQHVMNISPSFFDISDVYRPACRTAHAGRAAYLEKSASWQGGHLTGSQLAETLGVIPPQDELLEQAKSAFEADQIKIAYFLSEVENAIEENANLAGDLLSNYVYVNPHRKAAFDQYDFGQSADAKNQHLRTLAEHGIVLPFDVFAEKIANVRDTLVVKSAKAQLPGIYTDMLNNGDILSFIRRNPFNPERLAAGHPRAVKFAQDNCRTVSLDPQYTQHQIYVAKLAELPCPKFVTLQKLAMDESDANRDGLNLARVYSMYKLGSFYLTARNPAQTNLTNYAGNLVREHYLSA